MKKCMMLIILFFASIICVQATHIRGAYISYENTGALTYKFTVNVISKPSMQMFDSIVFNTGDGAFIRFPLVKNQSIFGGYQLLEYSGSHTYQSIAPGYYVTSIQFTNRNDYIINISNSINVLTYVEDTVFITPATPNNSPRSSKEYVFYGLVNKPFHGNLGMFDIDGDALKYELVIPKQSGLFDVPDYQFPDEITPGPNNSFKIDEHTGEISWDSPQQQGIYSVAVKVTEIKQQKVISTTIVDFIIIILDCQNFEPELGDFSAWPTDSLGRYSVTVNPGDTLQFPITYADSSQPFLNLSAFGEPFLDTTANISFLASLAPGLVTGNFKWIPNGSNERCTPYLINFRGYSEAPGTSGGTCYYTEDVTLMVFVRDSTSIYGDCYKTVSGIDAPLAPALTVYPNPTDNYTLFEMGNISDYTVVIYDIHGKPVKIQKSFQSTQIKVHTTELPSGLYIYQVYVNNNRVSSGKFIKR